MPVDVLGIAPIVLKTIKHLVGDVMSIMLTTSLSQDCILVPNLCLVELEAEVQYYLLTCCKIICQPGCKIKPTATWTVGEFASH